MKTTNSSERLELGQELHKAEVEIGVGRRAVRALRAAELVDEAAVVAQRARIEHARLTRNALRPQLDQAKSREYWTYKPQPTWPR
jgi:Spy/CpxP family protein refolding chaperone